MGASSRATLTCATCHPSAAMRGRYRLNLRAGWATLTDGGGSSVGQSSGLIIRRSEVRVLPAPPLLTSVFISSAGSVDGSGAPCANGLPTPKRAERRLQGLRRL